MLSKATICYLFQYKTISPGICFSIIKIRWSWDHLIFVMGILMLVRWHLYIETVCWLWPSDGPVYIYIYMLCFLVMDLHYIMWSNLHTEKGHPSTIIFSMEFPHYPLKTELSAWFPAWISNHINYKLWDGVTLSIPKLQQLYCWSLGMDK